MKDVHKFSRLGYKLEDSPNSGFMIRHNFESSLVVELKYRKHLDQQSMEVKDSVLCKLNESFSLGGDGVLRYQRRLCVPNVDYLSNQILEEAHWSCYSIHPSYTKMYHDLREVFFSKV